VSLLGIVKLTPNQILLGLKLRKAILAHTCSSASIAKVSILPTQSNALFGSIASTKSGTLKNMPNSGKPGETQSVQA